MSQISYPVYQLSTHKPTWEEGVVLYLYIGGNSIEKYSIVDDINVIGNTLAKRRLRMLSEGVKLKSIGRAIFFLGDLVKIATSIMWFIDSSGNVFRYVKKKNVRLVFRKIVKTHQILSGGAILEVEGIPNRFKCLYAPKPSERYAGILVYGMAYILYGVYEDKYDDTWRKI